MGPLYLVTETFDPSHGDKWTGYVEWSGLKQLKELVSVDSMLCPSVAGDLQVEDWPHILNEEFMLRYFTDLDYLLQRCGSVEGRNLLCLFRNPATEPMAPVGRFEFVLEGYDLADIWGGPSALSNCGGFPAAFANDELNDRGLLPTLARAIEVQAALRLHHPDEAHAQCHVWAVFRARSGTSART